MLMYYLLQKLFVNVHWKPVHSVSYHILYAQFVDVLTLFLKIQDLPAFQRILVTSS